MVTNSVSASTPMVVPPGTPTSALMVVGAGGVGTPILSTSGSLHRRVATPSGGGGVGGGGAQQLVVKGQGNGTKHHVLRGMPGSEMSDDQVQQSRVITHTLTTIIYVSTGFTT